MAPTGPSVQGLALWAGADLMEVGLTPATPTVHALSRRAEADLAGAGWHRRSECLRTEQVGWGGPDGSRAGTNDFLQPNGWPGGLRPDLTGLGWYRRFLGVQWLGLGGRE
ncbi:hypothetical protein GCM10010483_09740 [Actinokineospora diospyrosa]